VKADITLECPVHRSARVLQCAGMFDVPLEEKTSLRLSADLPLDERPWNVGLVTGPSGAGKSQIARHLWPAEIAAAHEWPAGEALVDAFPEHMGIRDVTALLSSVGLSSPPAWLRPFGTLSTGEAFRAQVARALAETGGLVVVDEFSSVVDRQVAQVASHAIQKAVRKAGRRFVAVTCHYDVTEWLQPDWVLEMPAGSFSWRSVQRHPEIRLDVHRADRRLWPVFRRHHYLSSSLNPSARCFAAYVDGRPVAFASYMHFPHATAKNIKVSHRVVVLPDWQGLGIAGRLSEWLGQSLHQQGFRFRATTAHPARIAYYARSPRWRMDGAARTVRGGKMTARAGGRRWGGDPRSLTTRTFEYVPTR
jgi:ABC-type lipoprotein export system ATPase subunit/GNAT superfamily N-acetyltransferase